MENNVNKNDDVIDVSVKLTESRYSITIVYDSNPDEPDYDDFEVLVNEDFTPKIKVFDLIIRERWRTKEDTMRFLEMALKAFKENF